MPIITVSELNLVEDDLGSLQKIEEQPSESPDTSVSSGFLGLLTLDYYQGFFDVTTMQVRNRKSSLTILPLIFRIRVYTIIIILCYCAAVSRVRGQVHSTPTSTTH